MDEFNYYKIEYTDTAYAIEVTLEDDLRRSGHLRELRYMYAADAGAVLSAGGGVV